MNFADRLKSKNTTDEKKKTYTLEEINEAINMANASIIAAELPGIDLMTKLTMVAVLNNYAEILKNILIKKD